MKEIRNIWFLFSSIKENYLQTGKGITNWRLSQMERVGVPGYLTWMISTPQFQILIQNFIMKCRYDHWVWKKIDTKINSDSQEYRIEIIESGDCHVIPSKLLEYIFLK